MAKPESPELASLRSRLKDQWGDDPDSAQRADEAIAVFASWWAELRVGRSQFLSAVQALRSERRRKPSVGRGDPARPFGAGEGRAGSAARDGGRQ